jgi:hypothetical protein
MNQTHADPSSSGSAGRRWHSRPSFRHAAGLLVLAALAGAGWFGWHKLQAGKNVREQYVLATVQRGDIEDLVSATGTVQPRDYVDVGAQVTTTELNSDNDLLSELFTSYGFFRHLLYSLSFDFIRPSEHDRVVYNVYVSELI